MSQELFNQMLNEYFGTDEREKAILRLVDRYETKVSRRLLSMRNRIRANAKENADRLFTECINTPSPFLDKIKASAEWTGFGAEIPIPFKGEP